MTALRILAGQGMPVTESAVNAGFSNVCELTGLMGRWMTVQKTPVRVICDRAQHRLLAPPRTAPVLYRRTWQTARGARVRKRQRLDAIFATMPTDAAYYFTAPASTAHARLNRQHRWLSFME